jgi:sugar/nucleoside kinase (ribokinase family)
VSAIAVAGHVCLDITPRLGAEASVSPGQLIEVGALAMTAGGSVANTGGALSALGARVVPIATLGDDGVAHILRAKLRELGLDSDGLVTVAGGSTSYSIVIESPGQDRTFWHHTGTNATFDGAAVEPSGVDIFHLGYPPLLPALLPDRAAALRRLLESARRSGATTSVDLAVVDPTSAVGSLDWHGILEAIAPVTDVLTPSLDDLTSALGITEPFSVELIDRLSNWLITAGVGVVAISAGSHGLFIRTASAARLAAGGSALAAVSGEWAERELHWAPVEVENVVTTNGAGDAASAGLLYALGAGAGLDLAGLLATAAAAAHIGGARPTPSAVIALNPALGSLWERTTP